MTNSSIVTLNSKSSFSKKDVKGLVAGLNLPAVDVELALASVSKTMIGREDVIDLLLNVAIGVHSDDTGLIMTPDLLIYHINKKVGKPTFTGVVLVEVIKDIWTSIASTLHQYPAGHKMVKTLISELVQRYGKATSTGVKQVREFIKIRALELYAEM